MKKTKKTKKTLRIAGLLLAGLLLCAVLGGCGAGSASQEQPTPEPVQSTPAPTPEPTPEPTAEPTPEPAPEGGGTLADEQIGQFILCGQQFTLPITGTELDAVGFTVDSFEPYEEDVVWAYDLWWPDRLTAMASEWDKDLYRAEGLFRPGVIDSWGDEIEWDVLGAMTIDAVSVSYTRRDGGRADWLELPGGIGFSSSLDDVIAAYGEPSGRSMGLDGPVLQYDSEGYWMDLSFDTWLNNQDPSGDLTRVTIGQMPRW